MKKLSWAVLLTILSSCDKKTTEGPGPFRHVDQVLWVVSDLDNTIHHWKNLGFNQVVGPDTIDAQLLKSGKTVKLRTAMANLGGAHVTWIQPLGGESVFHEFHASYGDGAMSLVHRVENEAALLDESNRLSDIGLGVREEIQLEIRSVNLHYLLMDSRDEGKYILGLTCGDSDAKWMETLSNENLHELRIDQYAFAIRDEKPVSAYWEKIGFPAFRISHPALGKKHYYDRPVDHDLIQGWQRHGDIAYEWCVPVSTPIVYDDHIKKHGEGIHHLAFTVKELDRVLADYRSKGYVVSMGGTWGEEGKPGSGRYEYIDLEEAGGVTMELLWSHEK